ncbi:MAG TPA: phosphoribosyl transferase, partial [Actinobacteria bacterium]|nr:phosphoribosyl transferase [Actinomycetota bacterium]
MALPVAQRLGADLDVLVVRKLGAPGNPEFAMGAVGEDGILVMDHEARRQLHVTEDEVSIAARRELAEVDRRVAMYRHGSRRLGVAGRNVIIVDDGLATGSTAAA